MPDDQLDIIKTLRTKSKRSQTGNATLGLVTKIIENNYLKRAKIMGGSYRNPFLEGGVCVSHACLSFVCHSLSYCCFVPTACLLCVMPVMFALSFGSRLHGLRGLSTCAAPTRLRSAPCSCWFGCCLFARCGPKSTCRGGSVGLCLILLYRVVPCADWVCWVVL